MTAGTPGTSPSERAAAAIGDILSDRYRDDAGSTDFASLFNALGALAGFGCQMAIREAFIKEGRITEEQAFVRVGTKDGKTYYFGDMVNEPLFKTQISVWSLVAGAAQGAGAKTLPDVREIVQRNAQTVGGPEFGVPNVPAAYSACELPIEALTRAWRDMQALQLEFRVPPQFLGWTFALAAQYLILRNKDQFDPAMAATIMMEAALPMSKMDPASVVG